MSYDINPLKPSRILMTADTIGGVWTYSIELIRGLLAADIQVSLATLGGELSNSQKADLQEIPEVQVFESTYKLEWMEDPWKDLERAGDWLMALNEKLQPDLIHLNHYAHTSLPWGSPT